MSVERLPNGWELVLAGGQYEGATGLAWMLRRLPDFIVVGRCEDPRFCHDGPTPDASHEGHVWFWLPKERPRPSEVVTYRRLEHEPGKTVGADGKVRDGRAIYTLPHLEVPVRGRARTFAGAGV